MKSGRTAGIAVLATLLAGNLCIAGLSIGDGLVDADVKMKNVDGKEVSIGETVGEKGTLVVFTCALLAAGISLLPLVAIRTVMSYRPRSVSDERP